VKALFKRIARKLRSTPLTAPHSHFHQAAYLRHNARRLEHLSSLHLPVAGRCVLEVGAGIGDHSAYYIDRGCTVTLTDARADNLSWLRARFPEHSVQHLDLDAPTPVAGAPFAIVHCYGVLYHLSRPADALTYLSACCGDMLLLETCVSFGEHEAVNCVSEDAADPTQSVTGTGCRPTRAWVFARLRELFEHVYVPRTQPAHEEFPLDWRAPEQHQHAFSRGIFIASRVPLDHEMLAASLLMEQRRQD
jgi:hypothetical protein